MERWELIYVVGGTVNDSGHYGKWHKGLRAMKNRTILRSINATVRWISKEER